MYQSTNSSGELRSFWSARRCVTALAAMVVLAFSAAAFAQEPGAEAPPAEEPPKARIDDKPVPDAEVEWTFHDSTALLVEHPQVSTIKPGRDWMVRFRGGELARIMPIEIERAGGALDPDSRAAFVDAVHPRWPSEGGTGRIRRYELTKAVTLLKKYLGTNPPQRGGVLVYRRLDKGSVEARKIVKRPLAEIELVRFPQTWENIWTAQVVDGFPVEDRLERVRLFDTRFQLRIENPQFKDEYFSLEEKAAYALFYQAQYAAIRDKNPGNAGIYFDLADYHARRDNVDAQLSIYLDAIHNEVDPLERQIFHYRAGEVLVKRLALYREAIPHLTSAFALAESRLLLVEAYHHLGEYEDSLTAAGELVAQISEDLTKVAAGGTETLLYAGAEETYRSGVRQRALLLRARALHIQNRFSEARDQIRELLQQVPDAPPATGPSAAAVQTPEQIRDLLMRRPSLHDESVLLLASMYAFRIRSIDPESGLTRDLLKEAAEALVKNTKWNAYIREAVKEKPDLTAIPYDPHGAQAVALWVEATTPAAISQVPADKLRALEFATMLDPLSADPWLVKGKLLEREGWRQVTGLGSNRGFPLTDAKEAYESGLLSVPGDHRLNYQLGVLLQRGGDPIAAERHFAVALESQPDFYPAMNRMAEIRLAYVAGAESNLASLFALPASPETTNEINHTVGQIVRGLRESAAYFASSLEVLPRQHAVRASLGGLYARLAGYYSRGTSPPGESRTPEQANRLAESYLRIARSHAREVVSVIRRRAEAANRPGELEARALVIEEIPPVSAYTVLAAATYQLAVRLRSDPRPEVAAQYTPLVEEAIQALEEHRIASREPFSFPPGAGNAAMVTAYEKSPPALWARDALRDLKARQRQRQRAEEFEGLEFDQLDQLGNGWQVLRPDSIDEGVAGVIRTTGGKLVIGVEKQQNDGFVTRVSRSEGFTTLRSFTAEFARLGRAGVARGIHMTKARSLPEGGGAQVLWSIMVGFDEENRLFYDVRRVNTDNGEESAAIASGRQYIRASDLGLRGLDVFPADQPVTITIEREVPEENGGNVFYWIRRGGLDGFRVPLDLTVIGGTDIVAEFDSTSDLNPEITEYSMRIGFFVQGARGTSGRIEVERCSWVVDSNLANIVAE